MARPRFLMVEPNPGYALSSRKLVLESAKYEVITARSWAEASSVFERLASLDGVILTTEVDEADSCQAFARRVSQHTPKPLVIALSRSVGGPCVHADYQVSAHEPESLLDLLRSLFERPSAATITT